MSHPVTVFELLSVGAPEQSALEALEHQQLNYMGLRQLIARRVGDLNAMGLGRNSRVAIVLPNGPLMATVFLTVSACATAAPLNSAYRADEFEFYLNDLGAQALIVGPDSSQAAIDVAVKLGIRVLQAQPSSDVTGAYEWYEHGQPIATSPQEPVYAEADDLALILHTSGTTSRPKIVPLTQTNICTSAHNVSHSLALTASDRGLHIMPMFHIHGLIAALLAPLRAGGTVCCSPGFNALKFFAWMDAWRPTWYTAVPTMHQAILARAAANADIIGRNPLRFLRSSSSSIPPQVIAALEDVFHAPLIEAYGMTEAAHQMASNPLPPAIRKPGTVGIAAGPDIAIMDEQGHILHSGRVGEIVIRGANVTPGYENNPGANASAFTDGWFRTGDQGSLDAEGYLSITGRLKEIINRGGEKISPREIDEVIMDHPSVTQVVTFAIPHEKLGEEVGAAVVLKEGANLSEKEIREFVAQRVADFKVPRKVLFVSEIPKGATGKLQRIGLAKLLGVGQG